MMSFDLPEDVIALRDVVRDFAANEIRPYAREWDRDQHFPDEFVTKVAELGLLGIMVPPEYNGAGLNYLANSVIVEEIARQDGGVGQLMQGAFTEARNDLVFNQPARQSPAPAVRQLNRLAFHAVDLEYL